MNQYSVLDICRKTKVLPMPAGQIMGMVKQVYKTKLQAPITLENLVRARNKYLIDASILN